MMASIAHAIALLLHAREANAVSGTVSQTTTTTTPVSQEAMIARTKLNQLRGGEYYIYLYILHQIMVESNSN